MSNIENMDLNVSKDVNMENDDNNHSDISDPEKTQEITEEAIAREEAQSAQINIRSDAPQINTRNDAPQPMNISIQQEVQEPSATVNCSFFFFTCFILFFFFVCVNAQYIKYTKHANHLLCAGSFDSYPYCTYCIELVLILCFYMFYSQNFTYNMVYLSYSPVFVCFLRNILCS